MAGGNDGDKRPRHQRHVSFSRSIVTETIDSSVFSAENEDDTRQDCLSLPQWLDEWW